MTVRKRDGEIVEYDETKIVRAIIKAAKASKTEIDDATMQKLVKFVTSQVSKLDEPIDVDDIHKAVENSLMKYNFFETARCYHDYRVQHDAERFKKMQIYKDMQEKLSASNIQYQNASVDEASFLGKIGEMDSVLLTDMAINYMVSPKFAKNHKNYEGYIHDSDRYKVGMHNCDSMPFDDLLEGSTIRNPKDLRMAGSVSTAGQLVLVHFQTQSQCEFGGVAATHLDWTFVPYVRLSFYKYFAKHYRRLTGFDIKQEIPLTKENIRNLSIEDRFYTNNNLLKEHGSTDTAYQWAMEDLESECKQAMEGLLHNLNTLQSRSGLQLPFSSINYGTCTLPEGRIIDNAILDAWDEGIGELNLTPIFPCGILQDKTGVNSKSNDPNYDIKKRAISILVKRDYPNFANCEWSTQVEGFKKSQNLKKEVLEDIFNNDKDFYNKIIELPESIQEKLGFHCTVDSIKMNEYCQPFEEMSTMGCRTWNGFDINFTKDYFKELLGKTIENKALPKNYLLSAMQKDGRGNIAPCTIVLPFIAMRAKKKAKDHPEYIIDYFIEMLSERIGDAKDELIERFNWICAQSPDSAKYMWRNNTMKGYIPEEGLRSAMKHGTLAIGLLGMAECLQILVGCDHTEPRGMEVAKQICQLYKDKCSEYKDHYKLNFGVYYTPAENLCYKSFKAFVKKYGLIENVTAYKDEDEKLVERGYFTNSIHVPVWKKISPFDKIDIESQLTGYSSAGCITYVEIDDEAKHNLKAIQQIIDYAKEKDIPYFALNFQINECTECGSTDIDTENKCCRKCFSKLINWLRRITGYLNGNYLTSFNLGKRKEAEDREQHTKYMMKNIKMKSL